MRTPKISGSQPPESAMSKDVDASPLHRVVMRGWRYFSCESCSVKFRQPSRDCGSPSGEACEHCGDWLTPDDSQPDESLPFDERTGNLTIPCHRETIA